MKFLVNDRVRWGTAEGVVERCGDASNILVDFRGRRLWFHADGGYLCDIPGQPLLEMVERPKKTRKVKVWRWERWDKHSQLMDQTSYLSERPPATTKINWTKVPGSEREIEIEVEGEG